jgi:elongation factor P (EF-P)-like protein
LFVVSGNNVSGEKERIMINATQLREGMIIVHHDELYRVASVRHLTPGNKRGFMQTKLKNLRTGINFAPKIGSSRPRSNSRDAVSLSGPGSVQFHGCQKLRANLFDRSGRWGSPILPFAKPNR